MASNESQKIQLKSMRLQVKAVRERVQGDISSVLDVIKATFNYDIVINCDCGYKSSRTSIKRPNSDLSKKH